MPCANDASLWMWIKLWVKPFGQQRPRDRVVQPRGKKPWVSKYYTKEQERRNRVLDKLLSKWQPFKPYTRALGISIHVYMKVPKSYSLGKKAACLDKKVLPTKTPDLDNIVKWILDRLQRGGYFKNDKQVCEIQTTKRFSDKPRIEVEIWEVGDALS